VGELTPRPRPLARFKGPTSKGGGEGKGWGRKRKERMGKVRKGMVRKGKGRGAAQSNN